MNLPQSFESYLKNKIARKITPDRAKADFLIKESDATFRDLKRRVEMMKIGEDNANSIIKECYDIIMEVIRAKMLIDGFVASGIGAHEAEVSYLMKLGFEDKIVSFINEVRYFRNSITYYGKILDKEYATKVVEFLMNNHKSIRKLVD